MEVIWETLENMSVERLEALMRRVKGNIVSRCGKSPKRYHNKKLAIGIQKLKRTDPFFQDPRDYIKLRELYRRKRMVELDHTVKIADIS